jgi:hypothetical protein
MTFRLLPIESSGCIATFLLQHLSDSGKLIPNARRGKRFFTAPPEQPLCNFFGYVLYRVQTVTALQAAELHVFFALRKHRQRVPAERLRHC